MKITTRYVLGLNHGRSVLKKESVNRIQRVLTSGAVGLGRLLLPCLLREIAMATSTAKYIS